MVVSSGDEDEVTGNAGWGLFSHGRDVYLNVAPPPLLTIVKNRVSLIASNGQARLPCRYYIEDGDPIELHLRSGHGGGIGAADGEVVAGLIEVLGNALGGGIIAKRGIELRSFHIRSNSGGGLFAGNNDLLAAAQTVANNLGVGLCAQGNIYLRTGVLCHNLSGDLSAGGRAEIGAAVVRCDLDEDGIADAIEAGAPNGGDGNKDGIADSQQPRVASFPRTAARYLTLASTGPSVIREAASLDLSSVSGLPGALATPLELIHFKVSEPQIQPTGLRRQTASVPTAKSAVVELFLPSEIKVTGLVRWSPLVETNPSQDLIELTDPEAARYPSRFYRALSQP